jgi:DNA-binding transcriptional LysR family regulator
LRDLRRDIPGLKAQIGSYDFLECIAELRAHRLGIAIVGVAGTERSPAEAETIPLYEEPSSLYCSADHPCAAISDPDALRAALAEAEISAHSFIFNPIDKDLDPMLLDQSNGVAQDTIELTAYLTLCGSHVGPLPDHYAAMWVKADDLVPLAPPHNTIVSKFHALRLRPEQSRATWR